MDWLGIRGRSADTPGTMDHLDCPPVTGVVSLLAALGSAVERLGQFEHYIGLLDVIATIVDHQAAQVMHYSRHVAPRYMFTRNTPADQQELYVSGYYVLDPIYRHMFDGTHEGVIHLGSVRTHGHSGAYFSEFYTLTKMQDELAILLPTFEGGFVGLFVQATRVFRASEIRLVRAVFPLLKALHAAQHQLAVQALRQGRTPFGVERSIILLDEQDRVVFLSEDLRAAQRTDSAFRAAIDEIVSQPNGTARRLASGTLQIHDLSDAIPSSTRGRICFFDVGPAARAPISFDAAIDGFLRTHRLTPRQSDILRMALMGYPSSRIARSLGLSEGTVRNHRKEIHARLDVTTEREIFLMFLKSLAPS